MLCEGFIEKHHIVPKCLGGTDTIDNLIALPIRAHFIAHALLHKAYPDHSGLAHAFAMMGVNNQYQKRVVSSKLYELSKAARSKALKGIARPEWVKEKLRKPKSNTQNYKKPKTKQHAYKISAALKGKPKTPEAIQKMRESNSKHYEKRTYDYNKKKMMFQEQFAVSNMTRKQFSEHHGINYNTMKKYLRV
jgi:hypothetical protein